MEKRKPLYTVGGNVNLCSYFTYRKPLYHMENSRDFSDLLQKNSSLKKIMNGIFLDKLKLEAEV